LPRALSEFFALTRNDSTLRGRQRSSGGTQDHVASGPRAVKEKGPKQHAREAATHFSEFKQNRPPHREARGPILAKRGSYFLFSKGRAKTNQA
jgi:hypothetical protein